MKIRRILLAVLAVVAVYAAIAIVLAHIPS